MGPLLVLNCISGLCILEIRPLSVVSFAKIFFFHSVGCLVIFLMVSFAQKLLSLIRSHWFVFIVIIQRGGSNKMLLWFMSKSVLPMFYSRSFIVSGLIFMSSIHFEFIFVYGIIQYSIVILLHRAFQFSQHHLLKRQI